MCVRFRKSTAVTDGLSYAGQHVERGKFYGIGLFCVEVFEEPRREIGLTKFAE